MLEWGRKVDDGVPVARDDVIVARVRTAAFRERADVDIDGDNWSFFKQSGDLLGERENATQPAFRASRAALLRPIWEVDAEGTAYRIKGEGFLQSVYRITRNDVEIGTSQKAAFWSNRPTLDVDPATPLHHQVFLLWVAFIMRRRAGAAAANAGGS